MSTAEPRFLSVDQVMALHPRSIAEHGGTVGVRDAGLIDSAVASARNTFWYGGSDLFDVAAANAFHLAEAQAFLDGNKRTGIVAALTFLEMNVECRRPDPFEFHAAMIAASSRQPDKVELAARFRALAVLH